MPRFDRPQWVFFDLDDTLWDFRRASAESLEHVWSAFPLLGAKHGGFGAFAEAYRRENDRLWDLHAAGKVTSAFLRPERWRRSIDAGDTSETLLAQCREIDTAYLAFLSSRPHEVDGASALLRALARTALVGVISNGFTDTQYRKLQASGLWRWVTRTVISDETGIQKPSAAIFEYALEETGCVARPFTAAAPIFVGDNFSNDVAGALEAGWRAVWFNGRGKPFPATEQGARVKSNPRFLGTAATLREAGALLEAAPTTPLSFR